MTKESFLDTIRQQYADEIREAYIECEHGHSDNRIDIPELSRRLNALMVSAKVEGLPVVDFQELVVATLPDVVDRIDLNTGKNLRKKAA